MVTCSQGFLWSFLGQASAVQGTESRNGGNELGSNWLQEMSWPEVAEVLKRTDVILLPVGATEQHGLHLPLGVDTYVPMHAAERIAEGAGVPIAPPVWFAHCEWHMGFPGTISLKPSTLIALLRDIVHSLRRHGFRNFIVLNGHTSGANPTLLTAADEIQLEMPDVRLWVVDVVLMAWKACLKVCEAEVLEHADEIEASQMLVARKDLVHLEKTRPILPKFTSEFTRVDYRSSDKDQVLFRLTAEDWRALTPEGQIGDPTIATEAKGKAMMDGLVENVIAFIKDLRTEGRAR